MASISRREHRSSVIWPGFVDALATLLMVIIFLLMIFVLAQFFLGQALSGRDKALRALENDLSALSKVLALTKTENEQLQLGVNSLRDQLSASLESRANLEQQLAGLRADYASAQSELSSLKSRSAADKEAIDRQLKEIADLSGDVAALKALKEELEKEVSALSFRASEAESKRAELAKSLESVKTERDGLQVGLAEKQEIADTARAQLALMNKQMAALRQQLDQLNAALDAAEVEAKAKNVQIQSLGQRLNAALATKVQELSRYRSEFFGRLRQVIGNRDDVRIVGDRFVLQSELLFAKGSADIGEGGQRELAKLATTLLEIAVTMPGDIDWILSIDGHTDIDPIATPKFPSNWELSTARALSVLHQLTREGIPPKRLAATGYGEHYPIAPGKSEIDKAKNRRIEFKFTQR